MGFLAWIARTKIVALSESIQLHSRGAEGLIQIPDIL
jgi:hypothetical protein